MSDIPSFNHDGQKLEWVEAQLAEARAENERLREIDRLAGEVAEAYFSYVYGSGDCASGEIETLDKTIDALCKVREGMRDERAM